MILLMNLSGEDIEALGKGDDVTRGVYNEANLQGKCLIGFGVE